MNGMNGLEFVGFPKIHRLAREIVITEKIDGSNAQIFITKDGEIRAGSRNEYISPEQDNFGFARWVQDNKEELLKLGVGRHYGEWWGRDIQRQYNQKERHFSLFNTERWKDKELPNCVRLTPVLYRGIFSSDVIDEKLSFLEENGSVAAPGFLEPEGVVIFHIESRYLFKKTLNGDGIKGKYSTRA